MSSLGILVCGDNHFIVLGPEPDDSAAIALARQWTLIRIGQPAEPGLRAWSICSKAFREDLRWAIAVSGDAPHSAAVAVLLDELAGRGVRARCVARPEIVTPTSRG